MLELTEKITSGDAADDSVTLPFDVRQKSRRRVRLDSGREASIMLPPGTPLDHGDRLRGSDGTVVRVQAAEEPVSTATAADERQLARACYHLGNRHVALQVGSGWIRYQPDHVLDDMVRGIGLALAHETARFEPERGAYHGHAHSHGKEGASSASEAAPPAAHGHSH